MKRLVILFFLLVSIVSYGADKNCATSLKNSNSKVTAGLINHIAESVQFKQNVTATIVLATPVAVYEGSGYSGNGFAFSNKVLKEFKKLLALKDIELIDESLSDPDATVSNFRILKIQGDPESVEQLLAFRYVAWAGLVYNPRALENLKTKSAAGEISYEPTKETIQAAKKNLVGYLSSLSAINGIGLGDGEIFVYLASAELRDQIPSLADGHKVTVRVMGGPITAGPAIAARPATVVEGPTVMPALVDEDILNIKDEIVRDTVLLVQFKDNVSVSQRSALAEDLERLKFTMGVTAPVGENQLIIKTPHVETNEELNQMLKTLRQRHSNTIETFYLSVFVMLTEDANLAKTQNLLENHGLNTVVVFQNLQAIAGYVPLEQMVLNKLKALKSVFNVIVNAPTRK